MCYCLLKFHFIAVGHNFCAMHTNTNVSFFFFIIYENRPNAIAPMPNGYNENFKYSKWHRHLCTFIRIKQMQIFWMIEYRMQMNRKFKQINHKNVNIINELKWIYFGFGLHCNGKVWIICCWNNLRLSANPWI